MNKKLTNILAGLFILHGLQNLIIGFSELKEGGTGITLFGLPYSFAIMGGFFSLVCAYLITRPTLYSRSAVFLRCLGGVLSVSGVSNLGILFGSSVTSTVYLNGNRELNDFINLWPMLLFLITIVIILKTKRIKLEKDSDGRKSWIIAFIILMLANWLLSILLYFSFGGWR